jgi:hypothetical protein
MRAGDIRELLADESFEPFRMHINRIDPIPAKKGRGGRS